jgi:uncharacterized membrane protein YfcA
LSRRDAVRADYKPLFLFIPICFSGFLLGMAFLQGLHVYLIQALFLSLSATFVTAYYFSDHRGTLHRLKTGSRRDWVYMAGILVIGGMVSSLFGTGGDIILYTLLVTRFDMKAKLATRISIILQAAISVLGCAYRIGVDDGLTAYQFKTWLCAYPVVLFMAPFGAYALSRLHVNWMMKAIIAINIFQLAYFNLVEPSAGKAIASTAFTVVLGVMFSVSLNRTPLQKRATPTTDPEAATRPV